MGSKVLKDKRLINEFLERGVEKVYPSKKALYQKLISGKRLRAYQGFDPTGPHLHVGHAMGIRALRILQQLGHEVIFLVGDFTALIGDPDKDKTRKHLTEQEVRENMAGWKKQASQLINFQDKKNPVKFMRNYKWLSRIKLQELIRLMSHITVQRMLDRNLFKRRIENGNPIHLQEFLYPLLQGYDSIMMDVDIEIGGTDQTFNMLVGRDLVKAYLGKEKFVRTHKMMEAPDGITMSKTKGNGINLDDDVSEMYGKAMSYSDELIVRGLELLTDIPMAEIRNVRRKIEKGVNPMKFKKMMAFEIVRVVKGENKAVQARQEFEKVFQKRESPKNLEKVEIKTLSLDSLVAIGAAVSKSQAKRLMEQGAVSVNGEKKTDWKQVIRLKKGNIIKVGPRHFYEVT